MAKINQLPQCIEADQPLLGGILIEGKTALDIARGILGEGDFYRTAHRTIFSALVKMRGEERPIDIVTAYEYLNAQGEALVEVGGSNYLTYLQETVASSDPVFIKYLAQQVKKHSNMRRVSEGLIRASQSIQDGLDPQEMLSNLTQIVEATASPEDGPVEICRLDRPGDTRWLLDRALPLNFPSTLYGPGGSLKSFIALFIALQAVRGGQSFFKQAFVDEVVPSVYVDFELSEAVFVNRAYQIAQGLGLSEPPPKLFYYSPLTDLADYMPKLTRFIAGKGIRFCVIDSLGAAGVVHDDALGIVKLFSELRALGVTVLIIDHQPKTPAGGSEADLTPYGSVYKFNFSRSIFQLSIKRRHGQFPLLTMTHTKTNFGRLLDPFNFEIDFSGDAVRFLTSEAPSPEAGHMRDVWEVMGDLEGRGVECTKTVIIEACVSEEILSRRTVEKLLEEGTGKHWGRRPRHGPGGGMVYIPNQSF